MTLQYVDRLPTPEEHRRLAESVGWTHAFDWDAMPASLAASVCGVTVVRDGETVAMGRVVGDGVFYFYVQDVVVLPELQGRGIGDEVLRRLVARVDEIAPPECPDAHPSRVRPTRHPRPGRGRARAGPRGSPRPSPRRGR